MLKKYKKLIEDIIISIIQFIIQLIGITIVLVLYTIAIKIINPEKLKKKMEQQESEMKKE